MHIFVAYEGVPVSHQQTTAEQERRLRELYASARRLVAESHRMRLEMVRVLDDIQRVRAELNEHQPERRRRIEVRR